MRIQSTDDINAALVTAMADGGLLLPESALSPAFFDLRTRLAGELFQKFTNYGVPLALVVADVTAHGERFRELAREHRTHPLVRLFTDADAATHWLAGKRSR